MGRVRAMDSESGEGVCSLKWCGPGTCHLQTLQGVMKFEEQRNQNELEGQL